MRLSMGHRSRWWFPPTSTRRFFSTSPQLRVRPVGPCSPAVWTRPGVAGSRGSRWMPRGKQPPLSRPPQRPPAAAPRLPLGRPSRGRAVRPPCARVPRSPSTPRWNPRTNRPRPAPLPDPSHRCQRPAYRRPPREHECRSRRASSPRCRRMYHHPSRPGSRCPPCGRYRPGSWRGPSSPKRPRLRRARSHLPCRPGRSRRGRGHRSRTPPRGRGRHSRPHIRNHKSSLRRQHRRTCRSGRSR